MTNSTPAQANRRFRLGIPQRIMLLTASVAVVATALFVIVVWSLASAAADGRINLGELVIYAQCVVGTSLIAFGGLKRHQLVRRAELDDLACLQHADAIRCGGCASSATSTSRR